MRVWKTVSTAAFLGVLGSVGPARADQVVQLAVDPVLTGRAVSTLSGGTVVPWTVGVDRNDGLMTSAAEAYLKQSGVALPDDGTFPADARHPEIVLHFSNAAPATSPQDAEINDVGSLDIAIPSAFYSKLFLVMTDAANGASPTGSPVTLTMMYADATTTTMSMTWPDYGTGAPLPADPPGLFNLISGMHKWNKDDMSVDTPTHALTGLELSPDAGRRLIGLRVSKLDMGKVLVFWGLTGVTSVGDAASDDGDADGASEEPPEVSNDVENQTGGDVGTGAGAGGIAEDGAAAGSKDSSAGGGSAGAGAPSRASNGSGCSCVVAGGPVGSGSALAGIIALIWLASRRRRAWHAWRRRGSGDHGG